MESIAADEMFSKGGKLKRLHDLDERTLKFIFSEKTPMTLLNEICAKLRYQKANFEVSPVEEGSFLFIAKATFDNAEFFSVPAPRKKDATNDAAVLVIDYLFRNNKIPLDDNQIAKIQKLKPDSLNNSGSSQQSNFKMEINSSFEEEDQSGPSSLFELAQSMVYNAVKEVSSL